MIEPDGQGNLVNTQTGKRLKPGHSTLLDMRGVALAAASVDDVENVRKAAGSRYGALTGLTPAGGNKIHLGVPFEDLTADDKWTPDKDGEDRSFHLDATDPHAVRQLAVWNGLVGVEEDAIKALEATMKQHPLGAWVKSQRGIGLKQAGRMLAALGDPYWRREMEYTLTVTDAATGEETTTVMRTVPEGPRRVGALWAYAGLHVLDAPEDAPEGVTGVAARRRKGVRSNWSTELKTRAYLVATSCVKQLAKPCHKVAEVDGQPVERYTVVHEVAECRCSPFRVAYDERRMHTAVTWAGRDGMSDGHMHSDGLRVASKKILKELWREARRLHAEYDPALFPDGLDAHEADKS